MNSDVLGAEGLYAELDRGLGCCHGFLLLRPAEQKETAEHALLAQLEASAG